jgi:FkbH-like protein
MTAPAPGDPAGKAAGGAVGRIKCVVWDLDDTLWRGVLLEDPDVVVRPEIVDTVRALDRRGILNSIASRNDAALAGRRLAAAGIAELFLAPQIGWGPKSDALRRIAADLHFGLDALAFVDDQPFERAEVSFALPPVLCLDVTEIAAAVATRAEFRPSFITSESGRRRALYRRELARRQAETSFTGTSEEFLAGLGMTMTIRPAAAADLRRAEELTVRTHQLNATGRCYSYDQLDALRRAPDHLLLVADLTDRFGDYGTIGLALVERDTRQWHLRLLLMSCRVAARGVGTVLLGHIVRAAAAAGVGLRGDFVDNGRNRTMYVTYRFAGFEEVRRDGDAVLLECRAAVPQQPPAYLTLVVSDVSAGASANLG